MDWSEYQQRFISLALSRQRTQAYIQHYLSYAHTLYRKGLPIIYNAEHLSALLGFNKQSIIAVHNNPSSQYITYGIPKKNGGKRIISEPKESLFSIQRWILEKILNNCPVHPAATAFHKNSSIKQNANPHVLRLNVLSLDIKDFFPSIRSKHVLPIFLEMGYNEEVSQLLTGLTLFRDSLPQGAPSSPYLSNLVFKNIDEALCKMVTPLMVRYTRYADDLTFSGHFRAGHVIANCRQILEKYDFQLNEKKTRLMLPHQCQEVTGVVVNRRIQARRSIRRQLRQEAYYIKKFGFQSHEQRKWSLYSNRFDHLLGLAEFVLFLNEKDRDAASVIDALRKHRADSENKKDS